ncbi:MAG: 30S ribosomal protein S30e [Desulfurococcaceae archaeon]
MPSHGSLTKAGKVRSATPKIPPKPKKNKPPRIRNRMEYVIRLSKTQKETAPPVEY